MVVAAAVDTLGCGKGLVSVFGSGRCRGVVGDITRGVVGRNVGDVIGWTIGSYVGDATGRATGVSVEGDNNGGSWGAMVGSTDDAVKSSVVGVFFRNIGTVIRGK